MKFLKNSVFFLLLYILPKDFVSCLMGKLVSIKLPKAMAVSINKGFAAIFKINLEEAEKPIEEYACLQDFFIRRLKPGLRELPREQNVVVSPCDGMLSVFGPVEQGKLIQAKGKEYSVSNLLRDEELGQQFADGHFATIYLSPRDYHRFHVPMSGEIIKTIHVPGALWPVNRWAVGNVNELFCVNDRVISVIKEPNSGLRLIHIAIGATMVGKIHMEYGDFTNKDKHIASKIERIEHTDVKLGQDLGKFMFGSTIVLLFERGLMSNFRKQAPTYVKMGEILGNLARAN